MTARFTVNGANTTITFEKTALTAKVLAVNNDSSEYLWWHGYGDHGVDPITGLDTKFYADLTNQQKLNLVDQHVWRVILDLANTNKSVKAQDAARLAEAANEHNI
jgi:hypothetical protein